MRLKNMDKLHEILLEAGHQLQSGNSEAGDLACSALNEAVDSIESDSGEIDAEGTHLANSQKIEGRECAAACMPMHNLACL